MLKIGVVGVPGSWSSERLAEALANRSGAGTIVDMERVTLDLETGEVVSPYGCLESYDGLVVKKLGPLYSPDLLNRLEILRFLSEGGLRVFSGPTNIGQVLDRMYCTVRLELGNIPMPPTVITESTADAEDAVRRFGRAVLKPLYTSKARGMLVVDAGPTARPTIERFRDAGNRVMYVQKMVTFPGKDLGLVFLGGRYIGTYARVKNGHSWNTTTVSGGRYEPYTPSDEVIELAAQAQDLFKLDFTCVDIAETSEGPMVFEVSAFGGFRGLYEAWNISAADMYAEFVIRQLSE
ncbi:MAG: GAK system ATP-grasp enzyme [Pseudomonadota bacterium]